MEEISFEDFLAHYELKLKEVTDGLQSTQSNLKKAQLLIESGWTGQAAEACRSKLDEILEDVRKTETELSDALTQLSVIGQILAEESEITV